MNISPADISHLRIRMSYAREAAVRGQQADLEAVRTRVNGTPGARSLSVRPTPPSVEARCILL
jgi:hypothetical protein